MRMLRASMWTLKRSDERRLLVEHLHHVRLLHDEHGRRAHRRRRCHPARLPGETAFAEEIAGAQHPYDGLFASLRQHRNLDAALLDIHHLRGGIALRVDDSRLGVLANVRERPAESRNAWRSNSGGDFGAFASLLTGTIRIILPTGTSRFRVRARMCLTTELLFWSDGQLVHDATDPFGALRNRARFVPSGSRRHRSLEGHHVLVRVDVDVAALQQVLIRRSVS